MTEYWKIRWKSERTGTEMYI